MNRPNKHILVVDDSATTRLYLRRFLTDWGYQVEEAMTGYEGIEKAVAFPFDLIIADINMPTMNGYAMAAALRQEPATQSVPILISSTESKDDDTARAYAAGANLYLVKPVEPDVLQRYLKFSIGDPA